MIRKAVIFTLAAGVLVGGYFAYSRHKSGAEGNGKGGRNGPLAVRVAQIEKRVAPRTVYAVGALSGRDQADVYSKVLGRITFMGPKEGEPVKAGQLLFRVDRNDPGETYLNAPIVSPISGWIGHWRVTNLGEQVSPSDAVVTVVDDRQLRATTYLPSDDWLEVTPNTQVIALVGDLKRDAHIVTIARSADLTSGRGSITLALDNEKRDWRSGMFARFAFQLSPRERILINSSSIIVTDAGTFVYLAMDDNTAKRVPIHFAVVDDDTVEVLDGLVAGQRLIVAGGNLLGDKSPIKLVDDATDKGKEQSRDGNKAGQDTHEAKPKS